MSAASRLRWQLRSRPEILVIALGGNDRLRGAEAAAEHKHHKETAPARSDVSAGSGERWVPPGSVPQRALDRTIR